MNTNIANIELWENGIFSSIEDFFKEKSKREIEVNEIQTNNPSKICIYETSICDNNELNSEFDIARRKIYDEWIVDLHKIQTNVKPIDDFISKQKYEGIVLDINEQSFIARLRNLSNKLPDEEAELFIEDLSREDRQLLKPGAVFYWNIGYRDMVGGQRIACHMINFRRLPVWTQQHKEKAAQRAKEYLSWINAEE